MISFWAVLTRPRPRLQSPFRFTIMMSSIIRTTQHQHLHPQSAPSPASDSWSTSYFSNLQSAQDYHSHQTSLTRPPPFSLTSTRCFLTALYYACSLRLPSSLSRDSLTTLTYYRSLLLAFHPIQHPHVVRLDLREEVLQ